MGIIAFVLSFVLSYVGLIAAQLESVGIIISISIIGGFIIHELHKLNNK